MVGGTAFSITDRPASMQTAVHPNERHPPEAGEPLIPRMKGLLIDPQGSGERNGRVNFFWLPSSCGTCS